MNHRKQNTKWEHSPYIISLLHNGQYQVYHRSTSWRPVDSYDAALKLIEDIKKLNSPASEYN